MTVSTSIWRSPQSDTTIEDRLDTIDWDAHPGSTGGRMFGSTWLSNKAAHAVDQFTIRLAEQLQYQAVEVFLSPPRATSDLPTSPQLIGGAYRGRNTDVYSLTQVGPPVKNLADTVLAGDTVGAFLSRIEQFRGADSDDPTRRYIQQSIAALCVVAVAQLRGSTGRGSPEDVRALPALMWKVVRASGWIPELKVGGRGSKRWPVDNVRLALKLLVRQNPYWPIGGLLLEASQDTDVEKSRLLVQARKSSEAQRLTDDSFAKAFTIWEALSRGTEAIGDGLARDFDSVRTRIMLDLFRARIHTYPGHLPSVTTSVEHQGQPVLVGDLRKRMEETATWRNQFVDVLALDAYESAAGKNLLIEEQLKSILLIPFFSALNDGKEVVGFVRLMNRYDRNADVYKRGDLRLHEYRSEWSEQLQWTEWTLDEEETELACALEAILRNRLVEQRSPVRPSGELFVVDRDLTRFASVSEDGALGIRGQSEQTMRVRGLVRAVATSMSDVLLLGDEGTGKGTIARCIHCHSDRHEGPWVRVSVADVPETLFESHFFGWEKGSFTGAVGKSKGYFRQAEGGTLFIDEIGLLPKFAQGKLLGAIQEREVTPVGGVKSVSFDARLIFATNVDLKELVRADSFRKDLWDRIRTSARTILLVPLAERIADIPSLLGHFLSQVVREDFPEHAVSVECSEDAVEYAMNSAFDSNWSGNARSVHLLAKEIVHGIHEACLSAEDAGLHEVGKHWVIEEADLMRLIPELIETA